MNWDKKGEEKKKKTHPMYSIQYLAKKQPQVYLAQYLQQNLWRPWPRTRYKRKKDNAKKKKKTDPHKEKYKQSWKIQTLKSSLKNTNTDLCKKKKKTQK